MKKGIIIPVVIIKTKSGYNAFSPIVEGCVVSDKTIDSTFKRMKEALQFHFEGEQLLKNKKSLKFKKILKDAFDDYGDDTIYGTIKIAA